MSDYPETCARGKISRSLSSTMSTLCLSAFLARSFERSFIKTRSHYLWRTGCVLRVSAVDTWGQSAPSVLLVTYARDLTLLLCTETHPQTAAALPVSPVEPQIKQVQVQVVSLAQEVRLVVLVPLLPLLPLVLSVPHNQSQSLCPSFKWRWGWTTVTLRLQPMLSWIQVAQTRSSLNSWFHVWEHPAGEQRSVSQLWIATMW